MHEIACGDNDTLMKAVDIATDVNNLISKDDACCNTAKIATVDMSVGSDPVKAVSKGCQNIRKTQDTGCDGI
jgi:hypothetical protein